MSCLLRGALECTNLYTCFVIKWNNIFISLKSTIFPVIRSNILEQNYSIASNK